MEFEVVTIFPNMFDSYLNESLFKRALKRKLIKVRIRNLRDFADPPHRKVDDRPYGGGPGMVMKVEPLYRAVEAARARLRARGKRVRTIVFSTRGTKLTNTQAKRLSRYDALILLCGRYEGVDERVAQYVADEEISIGDYVLSGGELPALVVMEAVSRFLPGFLGKSESLEEVRGSFPSYTRPEVFIPPQKKGLKKVESSRVLSAKKRPKGWKVPEVLLSGNHRQIEEWRKRFRGRT